MKKLLQENRQNKALLLFSTVVAVFVLGSTTVQASDVTPQIVGGSESTPYARPYQVALLMNGRQGCGGTLISKDWVLTAGHCLDSASTSSLTVKIGAHSMSAGDGTTHRVSQIISHENWRGASNIASGYDIAVLRLSTPASSPITPASLPSQEIADQIAAVGQYVTVSGWGLAYGGSRTPSDKLREVALPVISNSSCSSQLGTNVGNGVICGGGPNGTSACNGDSGGPYAVQSGGKYYSIGTVSWGKNCVGATAFTRTTAYLDWIERKTGVMVDDGVVTDELPEARFTKSVSGNTVSFSNNSTDDNGIVSSNWSFGDGSTSTTNSPFHSYSNPGSYTVTLIVTDTKGQTDSTAASVTIVGDSCPQASTSAESYPAWSASASYAIGDKISHQGINYEATWWSTGAVPTIYTNVWKVTGAGDGDNQCPDENEAPVASFSVSTMDLTASFSNNSSDDNGVVANSWSFGDGALSSSVNPTHTYDADGSYSVTLTVTDAEGLTSTTSKVVSVSGGVIVDPGCDGVAAWSSSTSYAVGDSVSHNGKKYDAIWWSTGASPEVFSNVWSLTGTCQ
ncbi:MAG: trypsin-like serine protease [Colwellia sp.]|nr:trypsin-like serine protease [Colwellia sp.]